MGWILLLVVFVIAEVFVNLELGLGSFCWENSVFLKHFLNVGLLVEVDDLGGVALDLHTECRGQGTDVLELELFRDFLQ